MAVWVYLSISLQNNWKRYTKILMNFSGMLTFNGTRHRSLNSSGDLNHHLDPGIFKGFLSLHSNTILAMLGLGRGVHSLSTLVK